jgi:hypothetical protein
MVEKYELADELNRMDLRKIEQSEKIHKHRAEKQGSSEMPLLMCSGIY